MKTHIDNFRRFQPLLYELVARDVKIKYRKSTLGILWSVLNPLLMMAVLSVVFSNLFRFNVDKYSLYILCGQTVFNFFNEATNNSMMAIIGNAPLIKKVYSEVPVRSFEGGQFDHQPACTVLRFDSGYVLFQDPNACYDVFRFFAACLSRADFIGRKPDPGDNRGALSGYYPSVQRFYDGAHVYDAGYLSVEYSSCENPFCGEA